jgi:hypothetical protein
VIRNKACGLGLRSLVFGAFFLAFSLPLATTQTATAQNYTPAPIDLGIPNFRQETHVWCWAAVAQQVIHRKRGYSPPQCALVAMARDKRPSFCCPGNPACVTPGTLAEIQKLIRNWGQRYSEVRAPTSPMGLYRTLRAGRPIILAIRNSRFSGHVVVLTGMTWVRTATGLRAILHINDPIRAIPPRLAFRALLPRWQAAIVIY